MLLYSINGVFITVYLAVNVIGREAISIHHPTIAAYEEDKLRLKCIRKLLSNYKPQITESLTTNVNLNAFLVKPQISIDLRTSAVIFPKENVFVLRLDTWSEMELFYEQVGRRKFHPRSKYIFFVETIQQIDVKSFFKRLAEKYICQVLLVQEMEVYTFYPYKYENLKKPDTEPFYLGYCLDLDANILNVPIYPSLWRNSTNRIYFKITPPYADENFQGIE
ncbi:uncharacterized protein LOC143201479 [Rhynchophorus ferrugineus]|uniref:uncharacterized protein LOC143201479 n=1 Tax=Rhynchophorus ferrugineus TaxID=354439 RepID=UPI003FCE5B3B